MSWPTLTPRDPPADVTLLLEGTYPMVRGGVSAWVDQLIRGLPQLRFALVFLGGRRDHYDGILFECPANVVHLECHYLMDDDSAPHAIKARRGGPVRLSKSANYTTPCASRAIAISARRYATLPG